jgi:hypothetical protein
VSGPLFGVLEFVNVLLPLTFVGFWPNSAEDRDEYGLLLSIMPLAIVSARRELVLVYHRQAIRFTLYDQITKLLSNGSSPTAVQSLLAGAVAGAVSVLVNHPVDVVKSNMQGLLGAMYPNSLQCARHLFRTEGIAGMYKVCRKSLPLETVSV